MTEPLIEFEPLIGGDETIRKIGQLSQGLQDKAVRTGLHSAGNLLVQAMRSNAPDDGRTQANRLARAVSKGVARENQRVITDQGPSYVKSTPGFMGMIVGPNKKVEGNSVTSIASITEWGAKPHVIRARNILKRLVISGSPVGRVVHHPGVKGERWMQKSGEQVSSLIPEAFYKGLEKWLDKNGR